MIGKRNRAIVLKADITDTYLVLAIGTLVAIYQDTVNNMSFEKHNGSSNDLSNTIFLT